MKCNASAFGKLSRVVDEIRKDLRKAQRVAHQHFRNFGIHIDNQLNRPFGNSDFGKRRHLVDDMLQDKLRDFQFLLLGFDFREIQDAVDNPEQRRRRMADTFDKALLAFIQLRFLNQVRHADNRVHRRADFVTHVGQEFALGLRRLFCNFTGRDNFRNINHRKHVTDNGILDLERTCLATEPRFRMRIQRLQHERVFPDALFVKCFSQGFHNALGHPATRQFIKRLTNHVLPICNQVIGQLFRHVHDFAVLVKNDEDGVARGKHDCIENRILLDSARLIGDEEQITYGTIVFDEELENDFPPGVFSRATPDRYDNLPFAGVHFPAFRNFIDKFLKLFGMEEFPKNFSANIVAIIKEFRNIGTRMQNVERIIREYNPKVVAPQKCFEHRTGTHAFIQVFFDKELEKEMDDQGGKEHERKNN